MLPIETGDVRIRYLQESDFEAYVDLEKNEEAKRFVGGANPKPKEQLLFNIRSYRPTTDLIALAERDSDIYIGRCGFLDAKVGDETEIHIVIDLQYQRLGIASRVVPILVELALEKGKQPVSVVDPRNVGSISLMNKLGWKRAGAKQKGNYENGFYRYKPRDISHGVFL